MLCSASSAPRVPPDHAEQERCWRLRWVPSTSHPLHMREHRTGAKSSTYIGAFIAIAAVAQSCFTGPPPGLLWRRRGLDTRRLRLPCQGRCVAQASRGREYCGWCTFAAGVLPLGTCPGCSCLHDPLCTAPGGRSTPQGHPQPCKQEPGASSVAPGGVSPPLGAAVPPPSPACPARLGALPAPSPPCCRLGLGAAADACLCSPPDHAAGEGPSRPAAPRGEQLQRLPSDAGGPGCGAEVSVGPGWAPRGAAGVQGLCEPSTPGCHWDTGCWCAWLQLVKAIPPGWSCSWHWAALLLASLHSCTPLHKGFPYCIYSHLLQKCVF